MTTWGLTDEKTGTRYRFEEGVRYTLGRDLTNHIVVSSGAAAARQLELEARPEGLLVRDAGRAQKTLIDGAELNGAEILVPPNGAIGLGRLTFRVGEADADAEVPRAFTLAKGLARFEEGARKKAHERIWSRGWRGFDGRAIPGLLGQEGATFWFRAWTEDRRYPRTALDAWEQIRKREDLLAPLAFDEVVTTLAEGQGFRTWNVAAAPLGFVLRELLGPDDAVAAFWEELQYSDTLHRWFDWLGPFGPTSGMRKIMEECDEPDTIMALADNMGDLFAGVRRVAQCTRGWDVTRRIRDSRLDPEDKIRIALEVGAFSSDVLGESGATEVSDEVISAVTKYWAQTGSSYGLDKLAGRVDVEFLSGFLEAAASPVRLELVRWLESGGEEAVDALVAHVTEDNRELIIELIAMMSDEGYARALERVPAELRETILAFFGAPVAHLPEAGVDELPPRLREFVARGAEVDRDDFKDDALRDLPPLLATRDSKRLPLLCQRGLFVSAQDVEWHEGTWSRDDFPPSVLDLIEPRSAFRCWWNYVCRQSRQASDLEVIPPAVLLLDDIALVWCVGNERFISVHEDLALIGVAPIGPLVAVYVHAVGDYSGLPDHLDVYGSPDPDPVIDAWFDERMPPSLPFNGGPIASVWAYDASVRGRSWSRAEWDRICRETFLRDLADEIVWIASGPRGWRAFRPDNDVFLDADNEDVELDDDDRISILHPYDLSLGARRAWEQHFADHRIIGKFPQFNPPDPIATRDAFASCVGKRMSVYGFPNGWPALHIDNHAPDFEVKRDFGPRGSAKIIVADSNFREVIFYDGAGRQVDLADANGVVGAATLAAVTHGTRWS